MDIVFKGGTIVSDGTEVMADLAIRDGRIVAIGELEGISSRESVDARGRHLLPGLVDIGVSLCRESEDWPASPQAIESLTADALQGGVTTVVFPAEFSPEKSLGDELQRLRAHDEGNARVDFSYHYLLADWSEMRRRHLRAAVTAGIPSIWIANEGMRSGFPGNLLLTVALREMPRDSVAITKANDSTLESFNRRDLAVSGRISATHFSGILPNHIEAGSVTRLGMLMEGSQAHVILLGISCKRAIDALQRLREEGLPLHGAATLAHLTLSSDCLEEHPPELLPLAWPPLRAREEQQSVWSALDDGLVNLVTSAHHPRMRDEVEAAQLDAIKAPGGVSGLGHLLPLLLSEGVAKFRLGIEAISLAACSDPAKMAGLYPRKGALQIGSDADIILCSLSEEHVLKHAGNGTGYHDPHAGKEAIGRIDAVYLRGRLATGPNSERPAGQYIERRVSLA